MPTRLEEETNYRNEVKSKLTRIASMDVQGLARDDLGFEMNFGQVLTSIRRIHLLYSALNRVDLAFVPLSSLTNITSFADEVIGIFEEIEEFSFAKYPNSAQQKRNQIVEQVATRYDAHFNLLSPLLAYAPTLSAVQPDFRSLALQYEQGLVNVLAEAEENGKKVQGVLEAVRRVAADTGVTVHAVHFKNEADEHARAAFKWLIATVVIAIIAVGLSGMFLWLALTKSATYTATQAVQVGIAKVAALSMLFSVVIWAGRVYRSNRHNYILNKHRLNALNTFQAFASAAADDATKKTVLLQATQCIFSPQNTGYIEDGNESPSLPQIIEVVRGVADQKSAGA